MNNLQKKQVIDVINKQLGEMYDDLETLKYYNVVGYVILERAIANLEATRNAIMGILI